MTNSQVLYELGLAMLALERLNELRLSSRNAKKAFGRGATEVGHGQYRVMVVFHSLFFVACSIEVIVWNRPFPGILGYGALIGALGAQVLRYWAIATLGDRWNTRIIVFPHLDPIRDGPYRYLRHPNYLAVMLEMTCVPLVHGCWITASIYTLGNAVLLTARVRTEELALGPKYSQAFKSHSRRVPSGLLKKVDSDQHSSLDDHLP